MLFIIYNTETNKIINIIEAVKKDDITLSKNEAIFENKNIKDFSQTDIRAYNKDGSVKSLEQQLKEKYKYPQMLMIRHQKFLRR